MKLKIEIQQRNSYNWIDCSVTNVSRPLFSEVGFFASLMRLRETFCFENVKLMTKYLKNRIWNVWRIVAVILGWMC
jgi:hypothetical protein